MKPLLYIASLPHSGSTLLNLLLGNHPGLVGLGGIDKAMAMIARDPAEAGSQRCTCGKSVAECAYWGRVLAAATTQAPQTTTERYELALRIFDEVFGPEAVPVDATKGPKTIRLLATVPGLDLRVIHLAKDYRSATVSLVENKRRARRRRGRYERPEWVYAVECAHRWFRENRKIRRAARDTGRALMGLGYEELCFNMEGSLNAVAGLAGLPPATDLSSDVRTSRSHLFVGNEMRYNTDKARLSYDYRWFTRGVWGVVSFLLPFINRANRRWVYSQSFSHVFDRS